MINIDQLTDSCLWLCRSVVQRSSVAGQSSADTEAVRRRDGSLDRQKSDSKRLSTVSVHRWPLASRRQSVSQLSSSCSVHSGNEHSRHSTVSIVLVLGAKLIRTVRQYLYIYIYVALYFVAYDVILFRNTYILDRLGSFSECGNDSACMVFYRMVRSDTLLRWYCSCRSVAIIDQFLENLFVSWRVCKMSTEPSAVWQRRRRRRQWWWRRQ